MKASRTIRGRRLWGYVAHQTEKTIHSENVIMRTEKQVEANRENAKKGGVKTEEGKAVSRWNAVQHGILSQRVVIETEEYAEDRGEYVSVLHSIAGALQPAGTIEELLVERIATTYWRLRRVLAAENDVMSGAGDFMPLGKQVYLGTERAQNVSRYEAHLDRCLFRAIHELQRLQAARRGEVVAAPIAVEVNTSGAE